MSGVDSIGRGWLAEHPYHDYFVTCSACTDGMLMHEWWVRKQPESVRYTMRSYE